MEPIVTHEPRRKRSSTAALATIRQALEAAPGAKPHPAAAPVARIALSIAEAAEATGWSISSLYLAMQRGEIPWCKIGARRMIRVADLEAFMAAHLVQGPTSGPEAA